MIGRLPAIDRRDSVPIKNRLHDLLITASFEFVIVNLFSALP